MKREKGTKAKLRSFKGVAEKRGEGKKIHWTEG